MGIVAEEIVRRHRLDGSSGVVSGGAVADGAAQLGREYAGGLLEGKGGDGVTFMGEEGEVLGGGDGAGAGEEREEVCCQGGGFAAEFRAKGVAAWIRGKGFGCGVECWDWGMRCGG